MGMVGLLSDRPIVSQRLARIEARHFAGARHDLLNGAIRECWVTYE